MKFQIFFDESHQLDKHSSKYCYYGILGYEENKISVLNKLFKDRNIKYEVHFSAFKLNKIDDYYEIIKFVLNNAQSNIYMVDCVQALSLGNKMDLSPNNLRKLFYIKLPERLIYGMTRKLPGVKDINITIDKSDAYGNNNLELLDDGCKIKIQDILESQNTNTEKMDNIKLIVEEKYKHIQLAKTLKDQLNSHSLYRNLNYKINKIKQEDSKDNVALQSIDLLLGVIAFIFEEKYLDMPEEIMKSIFDNIHISHSLNSEEEQLLYRSYKLKNDKYVLNNKQISNDTIYKLRKLNNKLRISSSKNIEKAEFTYRIISDNDLLDKLYSNDMFIWTLDNKDISKNINKVHISKNISKFLNYKIDYDNRNLRDLMNFHISQVANGKEFSKREYAQHINLNINNTGSLMDRYLKTLNL